MRNSFLQLIRVPQPPLDRGFIWGAEIGSLLSACNCHELLVCAVEFVSRIDSQKESGCHVLGYVFTLYFVHSREVSGECFFISRRCERLRSTECLGFFGNF